MAGAAPAALVTLNALGGVGGWFAATARLPFVAGIDRFLPPAFGALHPTWRTPYVALLVQAAIAGVFVFLGQAGTSVHGAYDALVSMGIITYFIPFLFMFAAMIALQREPAGPDVMRVPGGKPAGDRSRCDRLHRDGDLDCAGVHSARRGAEQDAGRGESRGVVAGVLVGVGVVVYLLGRRRAMAAAMRWRCCVWVASANAAPAPPQTCAWISTTLAMTGRAASRSTASSLEPLACPGNPDRRLDDTNRGKYFFEVIDAPSGRAESILAGSARSMANGRRPAKPGR